jgi:dUTP pyrophosphatase
MVMKIRIVNNSNNKLPAYSTENSAGMDINAFLDKSVILKPFQRKLIPTGLFIELPKGYEAQIRPRSGLAINHGITILNTPGTIDSDYRGEIGIILINLSDEDFVINNGDRICQMIINRHEKVCWENVKKVNKTKRGKGGFGHTGKK